MVGSCSRERAAAEIVERDDDFIAANRGPLNYFEPYRRWPSRQGLALRLARGRVPRRRLRCGRVPLHLQERGLDVVAVDISPLAVEVARRRGVRDAPPSALRTSTSGWATPSTRS